MTGDHAPWLRLGYALQGNVVFGLTQVIMLVIRDGKFDPPSRCLNFSYRRVS